MTGRRRSAGGPRAALAFGAAAIALFVAGAGAVIWALGDGDAIRPAGGVDSAVADPAPPAAPPAPPPLAPLRPAPAPVVAATAPAQGAPEDVDPSWRDVPVVFRLRDDLGAVGPYVYGSLRNARLAMKHCYAPAAGARGDVSPASADAAGPPAVLLLYLQSRAGAIDVVDARTEDLGSADPDVVECCRAVLRGQEIQVPNAQPGRRFRLKFALSEY